MSDQVAFGATGLLVSRLGFGSGSLGGDELSDHEADHFINQVLDAGVNFIDTARGYGKSEERIGQFISHRRNDFVLSTKVGYGIEGTEDWTPEIIEKGVDRALELMNTDVLDVVHLHSCPLDVLQNNGVAEALAKVKEKGKVKVAAYSGENDALGWAINSGLFGSVQTSVNVCDQLSLSTWLPLAQSKGLGVVAKRPVANAFWRFKDRPTGQYAEEYWLRAKAMGLDPGAEEWGEWALRFTAFAPGVCTSIVGTKSIDHIKDNIKAIEKGPLSESTVQAIRNAFAQLGGDWTGQT